MSAEPTPEGHAAAKNYFMQAAAASALAGVNLKHGGPFGAVVVRSGIFISCAHNTVLMDNDPTCHAEMNAIRYACTALDSHDLSDCELYTSCEPCPMCWGAIQWSRLKKVYTGVDRFTAAKFGFDDKVFYDELTAQSGQYAVRLGQTMPNIEPSMVRVFSGIDSPRIAKILTDLQINKTFRRRAGDQQLGFRDPAFTRFSQEDSAQPSTPLEMTAPSFVADHNEHHTRYMQILEGAIREAVDNGKNKVRLLAALGFCLFGICLLRHENSARCFVAGARGICFADCERRRGHLACGQHGAQAPRCDGDVRSPGDPQGSQKA